MNTMNPLISTFRKCLICLVLTYSLVVSGQNNPSDLQQTDKSMGNGFFQKPFAVPILSQEEATKANKEAIQAYLDVKAKERNMILRFLIVVIPLLVWLILLSSRTKDLKKGATK